MAKLRANGRWTVPGASGAIAVGWKVHTYIAGTTTNKDTYTDNTASTANANPVILDARGEATIYWSGTYKVVVKDDNDVTIWTEDDYGEGESADPVDTYNKALNGSFELDAITSGEPDNWTVSDYPTGVHSLDATDQYSGLNSLKFTSIGSGGGIATSEFFEVEEGKLVSAIWAMKSSAVDVRNVVSIIWYTSAQAFISQDSIYDDSTTNPTSWTSKGGSATAVSTARYAKIELVGCHSSDNTSGSTWYDNIVVTSDVAILSAPNTFTATQTWAKGADVASATALTLGADGNYFNITGSTAITSITTIGVGTIIKLGFSANITLTHDGTNIVLPGNTSIVTLAGDQAEFVEYAAGNWRCTNYMKYEEILSVSSGTITPRIVDASLSISEGQVYAYNYASYTFVGDRVFITGSISISDLGTLTTSDSARILLANTSSSTANSDGSFVISQGGSLNITAGNNLTGVVEPNTSNILLKKWSATTGTTDLLISELSLDGAISFGGSYVV